MLLKFNLKKYDCKFVRFISAILPSRATQKSDLLLFVCTSIVIARVLFILKNLSNLQFKCLGDIVGLDFVFNKPRFAVSYNLLSIKYNRRVRVLSFLELAGISSSVSEVFQSSNWLEREVWDLYGLFFDKHADLRRILTDYGFEGHPLRKDFPLEGLFDSFYSLIGEGVVHELLAVSVANKK